MAENIYQLLTHIEKYNGVIILPDIHRPNFNNNYDDHSGFDITKSQIEYI